MRGVLYTCVLLAAACGRDEYFIDASLGDDVVTIDATTADDPDAELVPDGEPLAPVRVTAYGRNSNTLPGARVENVEVLVYGVDGTLHDRDQTDSSGEVVVDAEPGDSVTAIYDLVADQDVYVTTVLGVQPGDELVFGDRPSATTTGASIGVMTLAVPTFSAPPDSYAWYWDCGLSSGSGVPPATVGITMYDNCGGSTFSAIFVATIGGQKEWARLIARPFADATTDAFPAAQAAGTFDIDFTAISPQIDQSYYLYLYSTFGPSLFALTSPSSAYDDTSDGAMSASLPWTDGGDGARLTEYLYRNGNLGYQYATRRLAAGVNAVTTPVTPLPWLSDTTLVVAGAGVAQWFIVGSEPYDGGVVDLYWSVDAGVAKGKGSGGSTIDFRWNILAPPGTMMLVFPELPEDLAAYAPPTDATIYASTTLEDSSAVDGYDALRALPEWTWDACLDCDASMTGVVTPSVRYSYGSGVGKPGPRGRFHLPPTHGAAVR